MNILPKKKWHVRTKENVARVRRDQREAAEEKQRNEERALQAERERRFRTLRLRADEARAATIGFDTRASASTGIVDKVDENADVQFDSQGQVQKRSDVDIIGQDGHLNFFIDLEREEKTIGANKEAEKEKKDEQESWEKKIGLLKYLGEGSAEYEKVMPWWMSGEKRDNIERIVKHRPKGEHRRSEVPAFMRNLAQKTAGAVVSNPLDARTVPINTSAPVFPSDLDGSASRREEKKRRKEEKKRLKAEKKAAKKARRKERLKKRTKAESDSDIEPVGVQKISNDTLERLRHERLMREAAEKARAEAVIRKAKGLKDPTPPPDPVEQRRKYNSQFNPEIARQNEPRDERRHYR